MRNYLCIILLIGVLQILSAQESNTYTQPVVKEYIAFSFCQDNEDKYACTNSNIESLIIPILENFKNRFKQDTLNVSIDFTVSPGGTVKKQRTRLKGVKDNLRERIIDQIDKSIAKQEFDVENYNNSLYPSWHGFDYKYLFNPKEKTIKILEDSEIYSGGTVGMIPLFPNSPRLGDELDRKGFQERMQNHIKRHFRYPVQARKQGIQGTVYLMFTIDREGKVTNIRMRSPHYLLSAEARRIVSELPVFQPAMQNGKAVRVPYSIPIHFRLR